jgi:alkyl hydroperoxide reductase subunit F
MLDDAIKSQVREVFAKLENAVTLVYDVSEHPKQAEPVDLLTDVSSASSKVRVEPSGIRSAEPRFRVFIGGKPNGIAFTGIPGGHEFSSLILAVLNSDRKGKLPDPMIADRIARLKGPVRLRTVVSLSCENCPAVVQALNLMAVLHPDFTHEMVDGEFIQEEVERLKIQGVPSVLHGDKLISSGKAAFIDLLDRLEKEFGSLASAAGAGASRDLGQYDVVVVGGGPAGATAAIYTARKGLKTAVLAERIGGQMQDTKGIENFISVPYTEGPQLSAALAKHLGEYPIDVLEHRRVESVESVESAENGGVKKLKLTSGEEISARALVITTGAKWRELGVPGEKEYLGRGVAFCPHCDGPYYKGKDIAVVGGGNSGVEAAIDLAGIVKSVTVFEFMPELKADAVLVNKLLSLPNTSVIKNARTNKVVGDGEKVTALEYEDRGTGELKQFPLAGIFVQIGLLPNSAFLKGLVETSKFGEILVDAKCRTNVKGIYAAGDVTNVPYKQIIIAMGEGAKAGLSAFEGLMIQA